MTNKFYAWYEVSSDLCIGLYPLNLVACYEMLVYVQIDVCDGCNLFYLTFAYCCCYGPPDRVRGQTEQNGLLKIRISEVCKLLIHEMLSNST